MGGIIMPTSHHTYISDVIGIVRELNPKSILDIGVGFGKWGHLFREYLDVMNGRVFKDDWKLQLHGVEIFYKYIQKHQLNIYDYIANQNIVDYKLEMDYDLIFSSDVIEHIEKKQALELIEKLVGKCKNILLIIPIGPGWTNQRGMYGNPNEAHISEWKPDDLKHLGIKCNDIYPCNNKHIGMFHNFH
jgi:SAM-dependent methyltransferase